MKARLLLVCIFMSATAALAAEEPFGVLDIPLGASHARMEQQLDFRDINTSLGQAKAGKPDLGRRGYGCMKREDPQADVGCVSHDERLDGIETREIRLHFLHGRLMQFSLTAEVQHYDTVLGYLRARYGEPQPVVPANPDAQPSVRWQSEAGWVIAYRGKDLVFVNFELASYADAVKRKREGASLECN